MKTKEQDHPIQSSKLATERAEKVIRDYVRCIRGAQPFIHNHYTNGEFLTHDQPNGQILNAYGERVVHVPEEFIIGVSAGLEEELGETSACEVMYRCGSQWGRRDMETFRPRVQAEYECEFDKLGMGMMLETWWWPLQLEGWGAWGYDFTQGKQGLIFIDLYESAVAKSLGNIGSVVCHFYAGMFGSVFSYLASKELACIEIQCYAMGEDHCKFLVSSSQRVDAASFWREEGATSKDIIKKLKDA